MSLKMICIIPLGNNRSRKIVLKSDYSKWPKSTKRDINTHLSHSGKNHRGRLLKTARPKKEKYTKQHF